jgi:nucleoside 2-deoxyribosyltransferase
MAVVYLAGPMENCSVGESRKWRIIVDDMLDKGAWPPIEILDPTRRFHGGDVSLFKRIFEMDLLDIRRSDFIIADLRDYKMPKHGTAMEVFYASYVEKKPVIGIKNADDIPHPFFEQLVTDWVHTPEEAAQALIDHYLN